MTRLYDRIGVACEGGADRPLGWQTPSRRELFNDRITSASVACNAVVDPAVALYEVNAEALRLRFTFAFGFLV